MGENTINFVSEEINNTEYFLKEYKDDELCLCYDTLSGRIFRSNIEKIRHIVNHLNARLIDELFIDLNDYYYEVGLPPIEIGNSVGWDTSLELEYSSQLIENNVLCIVVNFRVDPKYDYRKAS